jgi:hypothetical protein
MTTTSTPILVSPQQMNTKPTLQSMEEFQKKLQEMALKTPQVSIPMDLYIEITALDKILMKAVEYIPTIQISSKMVNHEGNSKVVTNIRLNVNSHSFKYDIWFAFPKLIDGKIYLSKKSVESSLKFNIDKYGKDRTFKNITYKPDEMRVAVFDYLRTIFTGK